MKAVVCENNHEITVAHACYPKIIPPRFVKSTPTESYVNNIQSKNSLATKLAKSYLMRQMRAKRGIMTPHQLNLENASEACKIFNVRGIGAEKKN